MRSGKRSTRINWRPMMSLLFGVVLVSGCGLTKSHVRIDYCPAGSAQKVSGAGAVNVKVKVTDQRAVKDHVGRKGSEYSFLGLIIATNDIAELVRKAIETELVCRGFGLEEGSVEVAVELGKFYAAYQTEFMSEHIDGEVTIQVQVKSGKGSIVFAKLITGQGREPGGLVRTGQDTKLALEKALQDAIPKLVNDPAFNEALFKAARDAGEADSPRARPAGQTPSAAQNGQPIPP